MSAMETMTIDSQRAHHRTKDELRQMLGSKWPIGSRLPPIRELASQMGTGISTTHRAVKELATEGLLVSKQRLGTFVSAVPNDEPTMSTRAADALTGKTIHIYDQVKYHYGVERDLFRIELADEFLRALNRDDVDVAHERTEYSKDRRSVTLSNANDADAIVLIGANSKPAIRFDPKQILILITTAQTVPVAMPGRFDVVTVESFQGSLLAGFHLSEAGAKRVAFLGVADSRNANQFDATSNERLSGFSQGWTGDSDAIRPIYCPYYRPGAGALAVAEFLSLDKRPDAVFAASDELAVGFINGALSHGLYPGRDYMIMGFDGQPIGLDVENGPMTTVRVPTQQMGKTAAELLVSRANDPDQPVRKIQLGCSIFQGNTAGSLKG